MTIDPAELTAAVEAMFGQPIANIKAGLQAGGIAVKRDAARKLLAYAQGRSAAKLATFDDELTRLRREHFAPVELKKTTASNAARQQIATLTSALNDLESDRDASIPTQEQIDAAIVGFGE